MERRKENEFIRSEKIKTIELHMLFIITFSTIVWFLFGIFAQFLSVLLPALMLPVIILYYIWFDTIDKLLRKAVK